MNADRSPLTHAEVLQLREELRVRRLRFKVWTAIACACAAVLIVAAGVLAVVLR